MSGPVAGVIGSRFLGDVKGIENLISFDTGGTSSDMAVHPRPAALQIRGRGRRAIPCAPAPSISRRSAPAAAASRRSSSAACSRSGPQSAGADPGPGLLRPRRQRADARPMRSSCSAISIRRALLDGAMPISRAKARDARGAARSRSRSDCRRSRRPGASCACSPPTSWRRCARSPSSAATIRASSPWSRSAAWGRPSPARVARELGIGRILVPRDPGTFSAWGMLVTDVQQTSSLTRITRLERQRAEELEAFARDRGRRRCAELSARAIRARAARHAAPRRHALLRPVLRGQRRGAGAADRRR